MHPMYPNHRWAVWEICIVILVFVMMGFQIYHGSLGPRNYAPQDLSPTQIGNDLKQEYDSIPVIPNASLIESHDNREPDHAMVGGIFGSNLAFENILEYYSNELIKNGWKFYTENDIPFKYNRSDCKSINIYYQKGDYYASIGNPGLNDKRDTYYFYISWGLEP